MITLVIISIKILFVVFFLGMHFNLLFLLLFYYSYPNFPSLLSPA